MILKNIRMWDFRENACDGTLIMLNFDWEFWGEKNPYHNQKHTEQPNLTYWQLKTLFFFFFTSCHHITKQITSFSLHTICEHVHILERGPDIQNSPHKTWKWIMSLCLHRIPPHMSESKHPSRGTSPWFLPYRNHVATFGELVLPQHVYACEHLSRSTK